MNTENNKIIAEFMDWKIQKNPTERFFGRYKSPIGTWYKEIDLQFHSDWSWLMEVVEKIESLSKNQNVINWSRQNKNIFDLKLTECKKEAVYNACVEFIKWYNEANK
jgi:hypothetical protein